MTSGRTFWAADRWWKRCLAVCVITATQCTSKVHRCASCKVESTIMDGRAQEEYVRRVLEAYRKTPGTMGTIRRPDRMLAAQLYQRGISAALIENAFVLAATRRLMRPVDSSPLGTIR